MDKRTSLSVAASAVVIATLTVCLPALAAETGPSGPGEQGREHQVPKKVAVATPPVAPRPPAEAEDPYRCHPSEDISCTVVRETAQGTLIVTMRAAGQWALMPAWVVISGPPPSPGPHPGGTVYVVPNSTADAERVPHQAALTSVNGAPIIE